MLPLSAEFKNSLESSLLAYEDSRGQVIPYLQGRGISPDTAERMRLGHVSAPASAGHEQYMGRLVIPSLGHDSTPYALRFRCIEEHSCKEAGHSKYLGMGGQETRLFNVRAVHEAGDTISITEGEIDAITLEQCGYHAVGVTGANAWKRHHPRMFAGFRRIFVFGDGDKAGKQFTKEVSVSLPVSTVITMDAGEDVNSVYVNGGKAAIDKLTGL